MKPNNVDKFTSYRYYNDDNIRDYHIILLLKYMGFSLDEIRKNKNSLKDEIFIKQKEKLLNDIFEKKKILKQIDKIRSNIFNGKIEINNYVIDNIDIKKINRGEKYEKKII